MNNNERFNAVTAIIGARGTGKTTDLMGDEEVGIPSMIEERYIARGIKCLGIFTDDHPSYRHVPILEKKDLHRFKRGFMRVIINPEDISAFCRFFSDSRVKWNTMLLFEDARNHSEKSFCKELNRLLQNSKQQNNDVFFMYHSFGETPPDLYRKTDYILLHKTLDSPERRKNELGSSFVRVMSAYNELSAASNRFESRLIRTIDDIRNAA
jgi:hypothetical protein